jgi:hypothetical protein
VSSWLALSGRIVSEYIRESTMRVESRLQWANIRFVYRCGELDRKGNDCFKSGVVCRYANSSWRRG